MTQNGVRHLFVVKNEDVNKPLGIISASDFAQYLGENLDIDESKAKILDTLKTDK